jgi:AI-2 transport protein TqsA
MRPQAGSRILPPAPKPLIAAAWLGLAVLVATILAFGRGVLVPLALAILIWHMINAIARRYRKIRILGETAPNWARLTAAVLTILLALGLVLRIIVDNVGYVAAAAPAYEDNLRRLLPQLFTMAGIAEPPTLAQLLAEIDVRGLVTRLTGTLGALVGEIGLIALYVAFLLLEQETFGRKIEILFPQPEQAARAHSVIGHIERRIERYLWIKTLAGIGKAVPSYLILLLAGVDYAGFWGLVVFLVHFIPTIGSIIGVVLPALLAFLQFADLGSTILVAAGLSLVQFAISDVLEPRLLGNSLNLSPVVMIASLALFASLWGIAGMFLCVPITVILMIICAHFEATRPLAVILSANGRVEELGGAYGRP